MITPTVILQLPVAVAVPLVVIGIVVFLIIAFAFFVKSFFKKIPQGKALVVTGYKGTKVILDGGLVIPLLQRQEEMDISLKKVEIERIGKDGLICLDNMRADIKVAFFVRVNPETNDVVKVAQTIGCERASDIDTLNTLFEAKFSEALKTVGKRFNFVDLYDSREEFKKQILDIIGTDLNGYVLDDCAIDYLEQTPIEFLKLDNILDAEGIKKITDLTAEQNIKANLIRRDEEKTIKKQDVEAEEAILELEKQLAEKQAKQKREIANIQAREEADTAQVVEQERLKAEQARIVAEEAIQIAEENKQRQVIVALKNKERTEAVENERVEKDRQLEATEREKIVTLAQIEKEKAVEEEKKQIQDVIRERVAVEKLVVEEEEKIKDLAAIKEAERQKTVAITNAEKEAESALVAEIKAAEAAQKSAEYKAQERLIKANADEEAAGKEATAIKILADADAAKFAAQGLSEAQVLEAKATALEKQGEAEASVIEAKSMAEAKGIEAKSQAQAEADQKLGLAAAEVEKQTGIAQADVINAKAEAEKQKGLAEANVIEAKGIADAKSVEAKAEAMKKLDDVGRDHEEFKLRLDKDKEVELAEINVQKALAEAQALVIAEALQNAKIDIVGGETVFFDNIVNAITRGKSVDKMVDNSDTLGQLKNALMGSVNGSPNGQSEGLLLDNIRGLIKRTGISSEDIKNLTLASLLLNLHDELSNENDKSSVTRLLDTVTQLGLGNRKVKSLGL